ncbi:putative PurR-regulated permease PerM [Roseibium hamelinense]|uniref:Putative PurR-regulated permease PerM n=1 Tax=Roseibium hamelinense TaxID=150831 RepID=A0A562THU0_9HYPH|nr:AI-2E family transporter [Roseibium hamelinense]MTI45603.1 AI-2E family transporter [Roseibium hamelinense]TWI93217.1 putative PurR-regulated permease PerM [Roseibium hamelinense]
MTLRRQVQFWLLSLAAFIAFMWVFSDVMLPFVAGMAVAYLLDPVCDRLEAVGMSRVWATLVILFTFVFLLILFFVLIVPVLGNQLAGFLDKFPDLVAQLQELLSRDLIDRIAAAAGMSVEDIQSSFTDLLGQGASWIGKLAQSLWSGGQALLSILSLFVITPVVAFYLLLDWDRMVARIDSWLPRDHLTELRGLAQEMDQAVAGFVRGQVSVCLILGTFYAVGLGLVGLNFGLLIGMGAGLVSFIPFVGAGLGFLVSLGVALVQFWPDWIMILAVAAVFGVGQFLEGNILQPKLVGDSTGLHPVTLMFALFAFGYLFGFVGMLIAVPAAAMIGVLARFALRQYLASPLYTGSRPPEAAPEE